MKQQGTGKSWQVTVHFPDASKSYLQLGIGRGNPGVFQGYPDPNLQKPIPLLRVWVFAG